MQAELNSILGWIEQLNEVNVDGIEPLTGATQMALKMREDVVTDGDQLVVRAAVAAGKLDEAKSEFAKITAALDRAAKRGIIHKNSADRRKSALNRALKPT